MDQARWACKIEIKSRYTYIYTAVNSERSQWTNSQKNGLKRENRSKRRRRQFHLLARQWHQFFGMHVGYFKLIIFKKWWKWWNPDRTAAFGERKVFFHQDNALVHISVIAMVKIKDTKFKLLPHGPHSPDLAPSDYFLFSNLEKCLGGHIFANNEEVESAVNG